MDLHSIPLCVPFLAGTEARHVDDALKTNWVSYVGPHVQKFEKELAAICGSPHAVALSSGTSALHIALLLSGVGPGDEVILPALTFVSPANAVRYCGATPFFVDVNEDDWQMNFDQTRDFLFNSCRRTQSGLVNSKTGRRVKAILLVHLLGGMGDVDAFADLADEFGLYLVEDGAEALGCFYKGKALAAPCDSISRLHRFVITSFNGNKIITTGGGGALFSHDENIAKRARHLSTTAKTDPVEFLHDEVGYNYRLTNLAAAMGLGQLENLDSFVQKKREIATRYIEAFKGNSAIKQIHPQPRDCRSTYWLFTVRLNSSSRPIMASLQERGISSRPLWLPIPRTKAHFSEHGLPMPTANALYDECLSLPCSVGLVEQDQQRVIENFLEICSLLS
jgi:perosamine synthetase